MNLAYGLKMEGYRVGILDADIYGPSQANMLGASSEKPMAFNGMIKPIVKDGIKFISMANLTKGSGPTIWRAPIAIQALQQFLHGVHWGELDYLLVDLPPGTGDIQISLAQEAQLAGAIIVSTPQKIAAQVAISGLEMFKQVNIPILGVVENMASFECEACGHESKIFKTNALSKLVEKSGNNIIARIPLDGEIMDACDNGKSVILTKADSTAAKAYTRLAKSLAFTLQSKPQNNLAVKNFQITDKGGINLNWQDGLSTFKTAHQLRTDCQCAECIDEMTGKPLLDPTTVGEDVMISSAEPVGLYGLALNFSDGHNSGIYKLEDLR
jgi:ATP-binding protein involved in chromosome partitioning